MKKTLLFLLLLCEMANAQNSLQNVSAPYLGLAAYSKNNTDVFAAKNNAASLAQLPANSFGIFAENRFLQSELKLFSASIGIKNKNGAFAFHGSYFGFDLYHQMQLSIGYGMSVTKQIDVGVQFNYFSLQQASIYGSASSLNASAGAVFHLTDRMHLGINFYNPGGSIWGKNTDEKLPAIFTFGMGFDASDKATISAEIVKEENMPASVNAGIQYHFQKQLFARVGVATGTSNMYAGIGLSLQNYRIDFCASYHPQLGISPGVLLLFNVGKQKEGINTEQ